MRNFQKIAENVHVMPLLHQLQARRELWNAETLRTTHPLSPHTQVDDVLLRFNDLAKWKEAGDAASVLDEHESVAFPAWRLLPAAQNIVFGLMADVRATRLGRVLITRLRPGAAIAAHEDGGEHAAYFDRYHVVLQGLPGSLFQCGEEVVTMQTGQVWWFDNAVTHTVANNSADDRIHMIVDLRLDR